ncbi:MAG: Rrf2 family transcriptional regulator [Pseudomonadales bacterium]
MRLSRFTDYAVRVLMYSAMHSERLVTLHELSSFYDISLAHLRKVVHKLGKLGYLKTARGKGGGLRLQQTAESINIGVVVAEFEGRAPLVDCLTILRHIARVCFASVRCVAHRQLFIKN